MKIDVLDHGYVELIEAYGTGKDGDTISIRNEGEAVHDFEVGIIEAARQSTQGSFRGWDQDAKLLKYLHDHKHATPFEFAGMIIEVQAPIFVFREWHRHRTQSYNEMSARYSPLPDLYYMPDYGNLVDRMMQAEASTNKQAQNLTKWSNDAQHVAGQWEHDLRIQYEQAEHLYQKGLRDGIPKELARLVMPVGHYSKMRASANLRNWLAFLTLRMDPAAQWEIRQYAQAVGQCIAQCFPQTWKLYND